MMIGVAQVMGMNPTFRSFFSGAAAWAKASMAVPSGKNCAMAASAVEAPTAFRNARRASSCGMRARTTANSTTRASRASLDRAAAAAGSCSAWLAWAPQLQPAVFKVDAASNGS